MYRTCSAVLLAVGANMTVGYETVPRGVWDLSTDVVKTIVSFERATHTHNKKASLGKILDRQ